VSTAESHKSSISEFQSVGFKLSEQTVDEAYIS